MFVTNWISTTKIQKISEITNFFRHYFLSRTEVYFNPHMNLISGNSVLTCDGKVKPFKNESGLEVLTLNNDETFDVLPNSNYLCSHNENFPGTILECKLYLNKDFLNNNEQY